MLTSDPISCSRPGYYTRFAKENQSFESSASFKSDLFNITGSDNPERVDGIKVSDGFFRVLGVNPFIGRPFLPEEDQPGQAQSVILSYGLWHRRFGDDRGLVGKTIQLNGSAYTVVGIMPESFAYPRGAEMPVSFRLPARPELWVPLAEHETLPNLSSDLFAIGRLKSQMSLSQAQADLDILSARFEKEKPAAKGWLGMKAVPMASQSVGHIRQALLILFGSVGMVLLIACANIANLMLARSMGRRREIAIRISLEPVADD